MKVLLDYRVGATLGRALAALGAEGLEVEACDGADDRRFRALLGAAEVLWHVLRPVDAADIARAPRLRLIQKIGVGVNTIDLAAAQARGIAVCNMPGTNARAVAEMTLLLMLACLRRLPLIDRATRAGQGWQLAADLRESCGELGGRTIGLVGYGTIPQALTPLLQAFGARVIYTATAPKPGVALPFRPLDALLAESDVVSLHLPLTPATQGLLSRARLALLRPGAILVNTARGGLIDQPALVEALRSGRLGGAGLDVFADEPVAASEELLTLDRVVVTPHLAWLTTETWQRSLAVAAENCRRLSQGEALLHRVA